MKRPNSESADCSGVKLVVRLPQEPALWATVRPSGKPRLQITSSSALFVGCGMTVLSGWVTPARAAGPASRVATNAATQTNVKRLVKLMV